MAARKAKKWQVVAVAWDDAVTISEPAHSTEKFEAALRVSVGHLIRRTREVITIAMEDDRKCEDGESDCQTITTIPIGMVRSITVMEPATVLYERRKRKRTIGKPESTGPDAIS